MADPQALPTSGQLDRAQQIEAAKEAQRKREAGIRAQAIQEGRKLEKTDILQALGTKRIEDAGLVEELRKEHVKELTSTELMLERHAHQRAQAAAGRWFGIASVLWMCVTGLIVWGVSLYTTEAQMSAVAAARAMNAPRGLQLPAPDASEQPEWARQ